MLGKIKTGGRGGKQRVLTSEDVLAVHLIESVHRDGEPNVPGLVSTRALGAAEGRTLDREREGKVSAIAKRVVLEFEFLNLL